MGVGIAHELLRAGATVIGCSRSHLDALPGIEPEWVQRSAQMVCDQGDYRSIDALVSEVAATGATLGKLGKHIGEGLHARHAAAIGNLIWATLRGLVVAALVVPEPLDTRRERCALVEMITRYVDGVTA